MSSTDLKLLSVKRSPTAIEYSLEAQGHQALETRSFRCHEAPLEAFDKAFDELSKVVRSIVEFRDEFGVKVHGLSISYTKHGTRSVQIAFARILKCTDRPHPMKTPLVQIDTPQEGEDQPREVTKLEADKILKVIAEAERYARGERQQALLPGIVEPEGGEKVNSEAELPGIKD